MASVQETMERLDEIAVELDTRSKQLHSVEVQLEPIEIAYQAFVDDHELGIWRRYEDDDAKLPSEKLRIKMAHKAMDPALYGRYVGLLNSRRRLEKRIGALKALADAQRSILSALKLEMEVSK
jgi:hypothetical protein